MEEEEGEGWCHREEEEGEGWSHRVEEEGEGKRGLHLLAVIRLSRGDC